MKNRHAPSFLFSLLVHIIAIFIFYSTYQSIHYILNKKEQEQEKICICLSTCAANPKPIIQQKKIIKAVKKIEKKPKPKIKKIVPKKALPKKIMPPIRKVIIKKKVKKKIVPEPTKSVVINKQISETQKEITTEQKSKPIQVVPVKTLSTKQVNKEKYINNNLDKISSLLKENLYYPRRARKRGITGEVVVSFKINIQGSVREVKTISSSSEILSRAALKTIKDLSGKFPKPSEDLTLQLPISYSLAQ